MTKLQTWTSCGTLGSKIRVCCFFCPFSFFFPSRSLGESFQDVLTLIWPELFAVWNKLALQNNENNMEATIDFLAKKVYDRENGYDIVARRLGSKFYVPTEHDAIFKVESFNSFYFYFSCNRSALKSANALGHVRAHERQASEIQHLGTFLVLTRSKLGANSCLCIFLPITTAQTIIVISNGNLNMAAATMAENGFVTRPWKHRAGHRNMWKRSEHPTLFPPLKTRPGKKKEREREKNIYIHSLTAIVVSLCRNYCHYMVLSVGSTQINTHMDLYLDIYLPSFLLVCSYY